MAFVDYPAFSNFPTRTMDEGEFITAASQTFEWFDGDLRAWADAFAAEVPGLQAALISGNLPSLSGQGGKSVFVNTAGTDVTLAPTFVREFSTSNSFTTGVGDYAGDVYAVVHSDTIVVSEPSVLLAFAQMDFSNSSSDDAFRARLTHNGGLTVLPGATILNGDVATRGHEVLIGVTAIGVGTHTIQAEVQSQSGARYDSTSLTLFAFTGS